MWGINKKKDMWQLDLSIRLNFYLNKQKRCYFGSIIKIIGLSISEDPILAIVLDRGGMIGFAEGKHSYFDLLYKSEADAYSFGRPTATFELLRSGY